MSSKKCKLIIKILVINRNITTIFFLLIGIYLVINLPLLLKVPPVWTDEAYFVDIINHILKQGFISTDLFSLNPNYGFERHAFYYPPLFFYTLAIWLKIFPMTIFYQRLFSLLVSLGVLFFLGKCALLVQGRLPKYPWWLLPIGCLMIDDAFLYAAHFSRPEILLLLIGLISVYLFLKYIHTQKQTFGQIALIGLLASVAFMIHYIGVIFFLVYGTYIFITGRKHSQIKQLGILLIFFVIPISLWVVTEVWPNLDIFFRQISLVSLRKNFDYWRWVWLLKFAPLETILINLGYFILSVMLVLSILIHKTKHGLLLAIILVLSWCLAIYGKNIPYFVIPLPFIYLAAVSFLSVSPIGKYHKIISLIIVVVFILNFKILVQNLFKYAGNSYSYYYFVDKILQTVPDNQTVFLSVIPDVYHGFLNHRRNNRLFEYPLLITSKENYLKILNQCDYIVFNGIYEVPLYDNLLIHYIVNNYQQLTSVNQPHQYQATIVKLKPIKDRKW